MKRFLCISLAAAMVMTLAACGGKDASSSKSSDGQQSTAAAQETTEVVKATDATLISSTEENTTEVKVALIPGTLYQLNAEDNAEPIITGVSLDGNQAGTVEGGVNGKPVAAESIRSAFELNEWISVTLESTEKSGISAYIVPHSDDPQTFTDSFVANLQDNVATVALQAPENTDDGSTSWGEVYVHPDYWQAGDYDLVFTSGEKPIARVLIKLYAEGELKNKSDAELQELMNTTMDKAKEQDKENAQNNL